MQRANLQAGGMGATAVSLIVLLYLFSTSHRVIAAISVALGTGGFGHSVFWMWAGFRAPAPRSTGAAKESLKWLAMPSSGAFVLATVAVLSVLIAAHNIMHPGSIWKRNDRLLLAVIFTDPQVAQVGLTEKTAAKLGIPCLVASYPFRELGKSVIIDATAGHVKLLVDPKSSELLGGACVGPLGGELIHEIVAAMAKQMTVHDLVNLPHYHPTLAEIWTCPAEELAGRINLQKVG